MDEKYLDKEGLQYLWEKTKAYVNENAGSATGSVSWDDITNKPEVALKSDLTRVYKYKGSVNNFSALPTEDNEIGDVWNVIATDMNYGWDGEKWDPLGQVFEIQSITNEEIDAIIEGGK